MLLLVLLCLHTAAAALSAFALLEHADEDGHVEDINNVRELVGTAKPAKPAKGGAKTKQQTGKAGGKAASNSRATSAGAGTSRATNQQNDSGGKQARAEDYYRAFEHVYKDASTGGRWRPAAASTAGVLKVPSAAVIGWTQCVRSSLVQILQLVNSSMQCATACADDLHHVGGCCVLPSNTALLLLRCCLLRNTGEVVLRFHKTNIVRIKPSGDVILNTGVLALGVLACSVQALPSWAYAVARKYVDLCCKCCRHLR
jgi:hypothetical protein